MGRMVVWIKVWTVVRLVRRGIPILEGSRGTALLCIWILVQSSTDEFISGEWKVGGCSNLETTFELNRSLKHSALHSKWWYQNWGAEMNGGAIPICLFVHVLVLQAFFLKKETVQDASMTMKTLRMKSAHSLWTKRCPVEVPGLPIYTGPASGSPG